MNKHTTRNSEEDLWNWAERREASALPEEAKAAGGFPSVTIAGSRGTIARKWLSMLGFSRSKRG